MAIQIARPDPPSEATLRLYALARREWDERLGSAVKSAANWRRVCFFLLVPLTVAIAAIAYLGAQPKAVPHIIEIDRIGEAHYRGPVGVSGRNYTIPDRAVRQQLRAFVSDLRSVSSDPAIIKANFLAAWAMATATGQVLVGKHIREHSPFARVADERVSVDFVSVLASSRDSWQVDWKESRFDTHGNQLDSVVWRGVFRLVFRASEAGVTEEVLEQNPLGIYIDHFDWKRMQVGE